MDYLVAMRRRNIIKRSECSGTREQLFLRSAQVEEGIVSNKDFLEWFESRRKANSYEVEKVALTDLKEWNFESGTGNIVPALPRILPVPAKGIIK